MAQHDYNIANGTGSAVRSDLNNALAAIVSMNSGSTEPSTTFAFQFWADTNANLLKMRNSANDGWIELRQLDGEFTTVSVANGTAAAPSIFFNASGTDTGIYSNGTDSVDVSTGGTRRLDIGSAGDVTVRGGNVTLNAQGDLRLADSDSSNWVAFQAPATVASNVTWTLPSADGSNGQALTTNGSGTLSWTSAGGASITTGNTTAEVVDTGSDGHFKVTTEGTEALRVNASQQVGIGTANPVRNLHINGSDSDTVQIHLTNSTTGGTSNDGFSIALGSDESGILNMRENNPMRFFTNDTERVRIDSSGRLLVGTTSDLSSNARAVFAGKSNGSADGQIEIRRNGATPTAGTTIGSILFTDSNASSGQYAYILAAADADSGSGSDLPGRLVFSTTADGASSPTERMRLDSSGNLRFNSGYGSVATAYGVRAWVNLNGTGTVAIRSSGNCSSITDVGTGQYQFNFATAMPDANYAAVSEVRVDTTGENTRIGNTTYSTTQFEIEVTSAGNASYRDSDLVNIIVVR